jgi:hypothetical protein
MTRYFEKRTNIRDMAFSTTEQKHSESNVGNVLLLTKYQNKAVA